MCCVISTIGITESSRHIETKTHRGGDHCRLRSARVFQFNAYLTAFRFRCRNCNAVRWAQCIAIANILHGLKKTLIRYTTCLAILTYTHNETRTGTIVFHINEKEKKTTYHNSLITQKNTLLTSAFEQRTTLPRRVCPHAIVCAARLQLSATLLLARTNERRRMGYRSAA